MIGARRTNLNPLDGRASKYFEFMQACRLQTRETVRNGEYVAARTLSSFDANHSRSGSSAETLERTARRLALRSEQRQTHSSMGSGLPTNIIAFRRFVVAMAHLNAAADCALVLAGPVSHERRCSDQTTWRQICQWQIRSCRPASFC